MSFLRSLLGWFLLSVIVGAFFLFFVLRRLLKAVLLPLVESRVKGLSALLTPTWSFNLTGFAIGDINILIQHGRVCLSIAEITITADLEERPAVVEHDPTSPPLGRYAAGLSRRKLSRYRLRRTNLEPDFANGSCACAPLPPPSHTSRGHPGAQPVAGRVVDRADRQPLPPHLALPHTMAALPRAPAVGPAPCQPGGPHLQGPGKPGQHSSVLFQHIILCVGNQVP